MSIAKAKAHLADAQRHMDLDPSSDPMWHQRIQNWLRFASEEIGKLNKEGVRNDHERLPELLAAIREELYK